MQKKYFDAAEYRLTADVNDDGQSAAAEVSDWRGETLFEADHSILRGRRWPVPVPASSLRTMGLHPRYKQTFESRNATHGRGEGVAH